MNQDRFFQIHRFPSRQVQIGDRPLGGMQPIRLQSMTNTSTLDIQATIEQSLRIIRAGADYVRISAPNIAAAEKLKEIKKGIAKEGFTHPLIADIHYNPDVALVAARYVEKIRINPGNYIPSSKTDKADFSNAERDQEKDFIAQHLQPLVKVCKEYGTVIRIGTNMGSLSPRIIARYGHTPEAMVASTMEFLHIFEHLGFDQLVVSLKASNPLIMIQAYEKMVEKMLLHHMQYPLHVGITEAGEGENGRIKSALGICSLLNKGIGDTLRVSLSEAPENEIPFCIKLSSIYQIPFTRKQEPDSYTLKQHTLSTHDTFVIPARKAIVIDDLKDMRMVEEALKPDFFFTDNIEAALCHPSESFITDKQIPAGTSAPHNLFQALSAPLDHSIKNAPMTPQGEYFLQLCCSREIPDWVISKTDKPRAVILDLTPCVDAGLLEQHIAFWQKKEIPLIVKKTFQTSDKEELICHLAILTGSYLLEKKIQGLWIQAPSLKESISEIAFGFLQSAGLRISKTEFISCPTCARTSYDLLKVLKEVQQNFSHLPGLKIGVMGCMVNGPGEMADADFGFVGTGNGKLHLYKGKTIVKKGIEPDAASDALEKILKDYGYTI